MIKWVIKYLKKTFYVISNLDFTENFKVKKLQFVFARSGYSFDALPMMASEWPRALLIGVTCQYDASQILIDRRRIDLPSL